MLKNSVLIVILLSLFAFSERVEAQRVYSIEEALITIEDNNIELESADYLQKVQTIEARVGNSLDDPEVEYTHMWKNPSQLGRGGELSVVQRFDFPTVYSNRNKLAKLRAERYGYEYFAKRQQLLLEAKQLCLEIVSHREHMSLLDVQLANIEQVIEIIKKRVTVGDASTIDENQVIFEYINTKNDHTVVRTQLSRAEQKLVALNAGIEIVLVLAPDWLRKEVVLLPDREYMLVQYEERSPILKSMMVEQQASKRDLKLSRSMSLPKLSVGYKYEYATGEKVNGLVVGMSIPLFSNRHNVKRANAQRLLADSELRRTENELRSTITELYNTAELLSESIEDVGSALDGAKSLDYLVKAVELGCLPINDYFSQLRAIHQTYIVVIGMLQEYHSVCAQINMIDL